MLSHNIYTISFIPSSECSVMPEGYSEVNYFGPNSGRRWMTSIVIFYIPFPVQKHIFNFYECVFEDNQYIGALYFQFCQRIE